MTPPFFSSKIQPESKSPRSLQPQQISFGARVKAMINLHNAIILLGAFAMFMGYTALPFFCPLIILLFPPCLFWLALTSHSGKHAFKQGWYMGLWGCSASLYWLTVPMTSVGQMPLVLAVPCVLLLGSFLGLYTGLAAYCFRGLIHFFNTPSATRTVLRQLSAPFAFLRSLRKKQSTKICRNAKAETLDEHLAKQNSAKAESHNKMVDEAPPAVLDAGEADKGTYNINISDKGSPCNDTPHVNREGENPQNQCIARPAQLGRLSQPAQSIRPTRPTRSPQRSAYALLPSNLLSGFCMLLLAGLCYGGIELASAHILTGFPWLSLPVALADIPFLIQPVSLVGTYGYTAVLVLLSLTPFLFFSTSKPFVPVFCLLASLAGLGMYSYTTLALPISDTSVRVGIAQTNIDQNQKWSPSMQASTVEKHFALSLKAIQESPTPLNLLLWSETAMPFYYQSDEPYRSQLNDFARQNNLSIGFGTLGYTYLPGQQPKQFNRLQLVSHKGGAQGQYDKEHLVPFGEYNPIPFAIPFLGNILQGLDFSAGRHQPLLMLPANLKISDTPTNTGDSTAPSIPQHGSPLQSGTLQELKTTNVLTSSQTTPLALLGSLICYEVIFPELAQKRVAQGADLLITISNDSWFGKTAAPQQHLNHAALRAVEQRRAVVRSTSSGYSALILPNGTVLHKSGLYTEEAYSFAAPLSQNTTIYHILYQAIDALLLLGLCIAVVLGFSFRGSQSTATHANRLSSNP